MGKYSHITKSLPKLPVENPVYQDRVDATKAVILINDVGSGGHSIDDIVDLMLRAEEWIRLAHDSALRGCPTTRSASSFARAWAEVRGLKDTLEEWLSNTNLLLEAYTQLMTAQMEAEGISGISVDGVGNVTSHEEPYSRIADPAAFRSWFLADPDLSQKATLMWQTMDGLVRRMLLDGEPPPPGVEVFTRTKVKLIGEKKGVRDAD